MVVRGSACEAASCTSRSGTSIESGSDKSVPEGVRPDHLSDPGPPGHSADDAASGMAVEALPIGAYKDRPGEPLADGEVDRSGRTRR